MGDQEKSTNADTAELCPSNITNETRGLNDAELKVPTQTESFKCSDDVSHVRELIKIHNFAELNAFDVLARNNTAGL